MKPVESHWEKVLIDARIPLNDSRKEETAQIVNAALAITLNSLFSKRKRTKAEQRLIDACVAYAKKDARE